MQDHYNLLYREEEREMLPLCLDQGVGVIPWSPLARGRLTRPGTTATDRVARPTSSARPSTREASRPRRSSSACGEVAERRGRAAGRRSRWPGCCSSPAVTAPIVGATKMPHLDDAVAALDLTLDDDERRLLEEPYTPHEVVGFA